MPELPEVETIRQDLKKKIVNKKITNVLITTKARTNLSRNKFASELKGETVKDVDRVGKLLIFVLPDEKYLLIHLKMTGQLIYQKGKKIIPGGHHDLSTVSDLPNKFTRITFEFSDGGRLFFNDMRRFGYLKIVDSKELEKVKSKFGIEPLAKDFTIDNFKKALQGRKTNIKALLLNQQIFAGIGNIYADEACFDAGIRPDTQVSELSSVQVNKLYKSVQKIIKKAIEMRGTTFNNYRDSDGNQGNFVQHLKVYGRAGLKCKRCSGIIEKTRVAGRGTHHCSKCQK
ncbi:MAG: bifunctional DNA-formamidopyrimidine glycosylase/DNA-(apurinic or apyrimidinic site) lyase [Candidatus Magasanikbacteria bacterium]